MKTVPLKLHMTTMKAASILVLFFLFGNCSFGQYNDPNIPKPTSGYGADGTHTIGNSSFANPNFPSKNIELFYPSDTTAKVPTIFYSHAFGGNDPANISGLLNFVAMKGYAIVFVPYQTTGVTNQDRYANLLNGFRLAARTYPNIIDTTKVGFLGWSFGGGASFANAYTCFTENNWGSQGRFIYAMAPWYSFNISQTQLQTFPPDTKLLTEIFDDDETNDHRMAIDIFNNINISSSEKDFVLLKSDTIAGYIYLADHTVPQTSPAFNALDYYGIYRLLDAICDYTFNGTLAGKNVALGNGSAAQVTMPSGLKSLVQTDFPTPAYPETKYEFPFHDVTNLRTDYFDTTVAALNNGPVHAGAPLRLTGEPGNLTSYAWTGPESFSSNLQSPSVSDSATTAMAGVYTLTVILGNGARNIATTTVVVNASPTAVENNTTAGLEQFQLEQNYPNPFNPETNISFRLPSKLHVSLKVFDVLGREIATVVNNELSAGNHVFQWNAGTFTSGVYFYRLQAGSYNETKKLVVVQ
jgi:Secretion system C-terminal sorting domain